MGRSDWQYMFNTFCFGYNIGYKFVKTKAGLCNGNFLGLGADDCYTAVEVEDDGLEAEHVCDRACDQREDGRQIAFGPYELGDSDQGADARELARITAPRGHK